MYSWANTTCMAFTMRNTVQKNKRADGSYLGMNASSSQAEERAGALYKRAAQNTNHHGIGPDNLDSNPLTQTAQRVSMHWFGAHDQKDIDFRKDIELQAKHTEKHKDDGLFEEADALWFPPNFTSKNKLYAEQLEALIGLDLQTRGKIIIPDCISRISRSSTSQKLNSTQKKVVAAVKGKWDAAKGSAEPAKKKQRLNPPKKVSKRRSSRRIFSKASK